MMLKRLIVAAALMLSGCAHISGGVAPSNKPLVPGSYNELRAVQGMDCVYYLLGIIPVSKGNETKDALAEAMAEVPGTYALINVTADTFSQFFFVVTRACTQVHGTAVALKQP